MFGHPNASLPLTTPIVAGGSADGDRRRPVGNLETAFAICEASGGDERHVMACCASVRLPVDHAHGSGTRSFAPRTYCGGEQSGAEHLGNTHQGNILPPSRSAEGAEQPRIARRMP